jgi:2-methylcitrate dehydratase PrpD
MSVEPVTFIHDLDYDDLPDPVVELACLLLLDLAGVAATGTRTPMSGIARNHAAAYYGSQQQPVRMLLDGRRVSPVGAAFAGAATLDSFDGHDGHALSKGHAGATVLPALLAFADTNPPTDGRELLTSLVLGYEIATRTGIALHARAGDYHASGAWNGLAAAAIGARLLGLSRGQTQHAVGIAEYHGPRGLMMRCIDHPTMVKDSSAAGAAAGVEAALLAAAGYTGAPATLLTDPCVADLWADLGERWRITEQYLKVFPVCRWAHPAIAAVLGLRTQHTRRSPGTAAIDHVEIRTFHVATRLATRRPETTEQAQYSLPFPAATALVHGEISTAHLADPRGADPEVLRLAAGMKLEANLSYENRYPDETYAHAELVYTDGTRLRCGPTTAPGDPERPLTDGEVRTKFHRLTRHILTQRRAEALEATIAALPGDTAIADPLLEILLEGSHG